jgi:hypothetical protein
VVKTAVPVVVLSFRKPRRDIFLTVMLPLLIWCHGSSIIRCVTGPSLNSAGADRAQSPEGQRESQQFHEKRCRIAARERLHGSSERGFSSKRIESRPVTFVAKHVRGRTQATKRGAYPMNMATGASIVRFASMP